MNNEQTIEIKPVLRKRPKLVWIPEPRDSIRDLLKEADVRLPDVFSGSGKKVATRKKLTERRKSN